MSGLVLLRFHLSSDNFVSNDALRKHGILPPIIKESTPSPPASPSLQSKLDDLDLDELDELFEENNSDTERMLLKYRQQRLEQMKQEQRLHRFGDVLPISRDDYTREVAEASKVNEDGDEEKLGTGVVCFLFKEGLVI